MRTFSKSPLSVVAAGALLLCGACHEHPAGCEDPGVRASSFGWNAADATDCLQKALDSGAKKLVIDRQPGDWIVRPLSLKGKSGMEIVLEDGVVVRAKRDEFHNLRSVLLSVCFCTNIVLRGVGSAMFAMNRADYGDAAKYRHSEWRHCLSLLADEKVRIDNLTFAESGGDGIYVNCVRNIALENVVCRKNYRQGMSVIRVRGLFARRCKFIETSGTAPQCGVDLEPNGWHEELTDIVFEDCDFNDNDMAGFNFFIPGRRRVSPAFSVTLKNCRADGNRLNGFFTILGKDEPSRGTLTLDGCSASGNGEAPFHLENAAARNGTVALVRNCTFDARGKNGGCTAISLKCPKGTNDFGDVTFENCTVLVDRKPPVEFVARPGVGLTAVRGTLKVVTNGAERSVDLSEFAKAYPPHPELFKPFRAARLDLKRLRPIAVGKTADDNPTYRRWGFSFVQYVPGPGEYPIRIRLRRMRPKDEQRLALTVLDPTGKTVDTTDLTQQDNLYVLKAKRAGVYRLKGRSVCLCNVSSPWPGHGYNAEAGVGLFGGRNHRFFFRMPVGAKDIEIDLRPDEAGSAELVSPAGEVVARTPVQSVGSTLRYERKDVGRAETWEVRFPYIEEDFVFAIGGDAVPVAATGCAENVLE